MSVPWWRAPVPASAKVPSWPRRLVVAGLTTVPLLVVFVLLPYGATQYLAGYGVTSGLALLSISAIGVVLTALGAVRVAVRPTWMYGPLLSASALLVVVYLLVIFEGSTITVPLGGGFRITIGYGSIVLAALTIPALYALAGAMTFAGDARYPGERLRLDYPRR